MASPIQTFPRGLLGLLGNKSNGRVPLELMESVQAHMELFPFYSFSTAQEFYDATAAVVLGGNYPNLFGVLTVPQTEFWYVHRFTIEADIAMPAGETHAVVPALYTIGPLGAGITAWCLANSLSFGPGEFALRTMNDPFWMKPGDRLGAYITRVVAGTGTNAYELKALVTKMSV